MTPCALPPAIAINGRFLGQPMSGVQRYGREAIRALDRALAGAPEAVRATIFVPPSVPEHAWPIDISVFKIRQVGRLSGHAWEQFELPRFVRQAVLVNLTNSAPIAVRRQVVAIHDAAICAHPDDFRLNYRLYYRGIYAILRRTPARFIAVSSFGASEIQRHFRIRPESLSVVPDAAEHILSVTPSTSAIGGLGLEPGGFILAIGGHARRKNLEMAERAVAALPEPRPPLVVVGGGSARAFASPASRSADGSRYLGQVSDPVLKALYENALCLAFPSRYEGFGLPPLEAMACGCPVIASRTASLPEICGEAALYCDPERPETMTRAILSLLADQALRDRLVAGGHERARAYSWRRSAGSLLEAVSKIIPQGPAMAAPIPVPP